jgi:hypothetical protein
LGENNRKLAIDLYIKALELYRGDFLAEDPDLEWAVIPREHYRRLFIDSTLEVATWFFESNEFSKAVTLLRQAIKVDPYVEGLQIMLMKALLGAGELKAAAEHYGYCSSFLYKELGVKPSEEWKSLYKQLREPETQSTRKRILEGNIEVFMKDSGPLVCEPDFFWNFILFERRRLTRLGGESSLIIFELRNDHTNNDDKTVESGFFELESIVYQRLRKCDITCRLDGCHLAILLPFTGVDGGKTTASYIKNIFINNVNRGLFVLQAKVKQVTAAQLL